MQEPLENVLKQYPHNKHELLEPNPLTGFTGTEDQRILETR